MLGVFHFSTINIANGNIIIFESSLETSNNIVFKYNDNLNKVDQIDFKT